MIGIGTLRERAIEKSNFQTVRAYIDFAQAFVEFMEGGLQATVIAQNNPKYRFFQYTGAADYSITRPITGDLFLRRDDFMNSLPIFTEAMQLIELGEDGSVGHRSNFQRVLYTLQQSIA
jgi:hypothetical protein